MKYVDAMEKATVDDAPTRTRVTQSILENGPSTAADLAARLHLTAAAVRRHLDQLMADGILEPREQRIVGQRGRGRPAKVFALTDAGRSTFEHTYDDLAVEALRFLAETGGDEAVMAFARHRLAGLEARYQPILAQAAGRAASPAAGRGAQLTTDSSPRSARRRSVTQMCQHHCPVAHVAEEFPQMCEAETEMFARLLGTHVQRLATIAHGDGVCTTHLPHTPETPTPETSQLPTTAERLPS